MKKLFLPHLVIRSFAYSTLALLSGCASIEVSTEGTDLVVVENSGGYLFRFIPIFSGDPDYPNQEVCNWFEDTVSLKTNIRLLDEEAARQNASGYRNLVTSTYDENILLILFKRKVLRTSAELIK